MFPSRWKSSKIITIRKSSLHTDKNNYRPISILCVISKIIERHIHDNLYTFLTELNLLHNAQSGFRRNHSCETALLKLIHNLTSNMEKGLLNGLVFIDFRKAFDIIDINILIQKFITAALHFFHGLDLTCWTETSVFI